MNLDDLEAKAKAATPGPWEASDVWLVAGKPLAFVETPGGDGDVIVGVGGGGMRSSQEVTSDRAEADAAFIAAASPDVVLALVAEVRRLRERYEQKPSVGPWLPDRYEPDYVRRWSTGAIAARTAERWPRCDSGGWVARRPNGDTFAAGPETGADGRAAADAALAKLRARG